MPKNLLRLPGRPLALWSAHLRSTPHIILVVGPKCCSKLFFRRTHKAVGYLTSTRNLVSIYAPIVLELATSPGVREVGCTNAAPRNTAAGFFFTPAGSAEQFKRPARCGGVFG